MRPYVPRRKRHTRKSIRKIGSKVLNVYSAIPRSCFPQHGSRPERPVALQHVYISENYRDWFLLRCSMISDPRLRGPTKDGSNSCQQQRSSSSPWPPSWPPSAPPASPSTRATSTACRGPPSSTDPGRHGTARIIGKQH